MAHFSVIRRNGTPIECLRWNGDGNEIISGRQRVQSCENVMKFDFVELKIFVFFFFELLFRKF